MKVLFYNDPLQEFGGAETYWHETAYFLEKNGVEVLKLVPYLPNPVRQFDQTYLPNPVRQLITAQFITAVQHFQPDIIHLNKNLKYAGSIKKVLQSLSIPVVATVHDYYTIPFATSWRNRLKRRLFPARVCAQVHIIPAHHYFLMLKKHRVNDIHYIPHFIHPDKWPFNNHYQADGKKLLYVGRLEKQKGLWVLLEAMRLLVKKDPEIQLTIIGQGSEETRIRQFVHQSNLSGKVVLTGGQEQPAVRQYMQEATLLVMPSLEDEMLGLVGLEAQACGLPVIASDLPGIREWCRHLVSGWTVRPGRAASLAEGIAYLLENPGLRGQLREQAREQVAQQFGVQAAMQALIGLYQQLLQPNFNLPRPVTLMPSVLVTDSGK